MFKNDWIIASLNNPTLDISDLSSVGELNTSNTQFLSKDQYLKSNFIQKNDAFKDQFGNFSKDKFDRFYESQAARWRDFQSNEFPTGVELDAFDTASNKAKAKVKDINFSIGPTYNPDRVQIGVEGWRTTSKKTKSESEIAQSQKIFNPETGKFENETPEDYALFSNPVKWVQNLFRDPLVLAQYEQDEVDSEGNKHKKGENKLNQYGTYYYEKLNGRTPLGKQILSAADILTKEESALNKVDFFDSDDLHKSAAGVVAKNLALIAPMFTPAAPYYYTAIIAKELAKTLPMLHSIGTNLLGSADNETPQWMNNLAAKGEQLSTTSSVWSKEHTFSFENFANLISDVALQWGQQKQIAKAVTYFGDKSAIKKAEEQAFQLYKSKIGGNLKGLEAPTDELWKQSTLGELALKKYLDPVMETIQKKQRLGGDLALAYMSLISNTDVYADMLERGATKKEAAWVALGSTAAMFSVDRFLHLGEVFYDDLTAESIKQGRQAVKKELKESFDKIYKAGTKESPAKWFQKGAMFGKKAAETFVENLKDHNLGGVGKALGEGLEEVSEELVTDLTKATYSLLGDLGVYDPSVKDTGAFDNMLERYSMSLIGGAIGGGLFYGVEKYKGFNKTRDKDLVDLINEGKSSELRSIIESYVSKGKAGNTKISGLNYSRDDQGNITWLSTDNEEESQNRQVANKVLEKINSLEAVIVGSGSKLSKDQLFDKMVLQEARYQEFKNASHVTGYYEEFAKRQKLLLETKTQYAQAVSTEDGTPMGKKSDKSLNAEEQAIKTANLQQLQVAVDDAQKGLTDFLSGDSSLDYTRKLNFALDPILNHFFLGLDRAKWLEDKIDPEKPITLKESIELNKQWNEHVRDTMLKDLDKAFLAYKALEKVVSPQLLAQQDFAQQYKQIHNQLGSLYSNDSKKLDLFQFLGGKPLYNMDSRLIDENGIEESEEDYQARNNSETPDDLQKYYQRRQKVFDLNTQVLSQFVQQYDDILRPLNYSVDASTNRVITQNIRYRLKDIISREMDYPFIQQGSLFDSSPYRSIISELKDDLSNIDTIEQQLEAKYYSKIKESVTNITNLMDSMIPGIVKQRESVLKKSNLNQILRELKDSPEKVTLQTLIDSIEELKNQNAPIEQIEIAKDTLYQILPEKYKIRKVSQVLKSIGGQDAKNFGIEPIADNALTKDEDTSNNWLENRLTIQDTINELSNPDSLVYQQIDKAQPGLAETLSIFLNSAKMDFGKDSSLGILFGLSPTYTGKETVNRQLSTIKKYLQNVSQRVQNNPVYSFYNKLKVNSHSPLENILSSITKEMSTDKDEIFNMNYILNQVYKDYVAADKLDSFMLNDTQSKQLENADKALKLLTGYLYSASTAPNGNFYFGQNKQINEFANANKDQLTREWEPLPEIEDDYASMLQQEVDRLSSEINIWRRMSENNSMNKLRRLTDTESIVNKLRYEAGKGLSFKFTINDKEYDLAEGIDTLPVFDNVNVENQLNQLFNFEQTLHNNFNKILKDSGLTSEQFFNQTGFWESYLGNTTDLKKQQAGKLNENLTELTKYDKALYLLSVLSDNPSSYYNSVANSIKDNTGIAPLTVQQNISRLGEAAHTRRYKDGFRALAKVVNPQRTVVPNVVYINGVAGSGKTEVVLKNIRQRFYDQQALIIGPTASQAIKLQNSLNENQSYTLDGDSNIFKQLVQNWDTISDQFEKAAEQVKDKTTRGENSFKIDTEYFSINYDLDNTGSGIFDIQLAPNKVKFNKEFTQPLIFVDEAAHMNTLQIALLDAYADSVGGTVFLASDSNQSGYSKNGIENLDNTSIFATRSAKLQESLRSSNVQKQANNNKVSALLDTVDDIWNTGTYQEKEEILKKLPKMISKLNLRVYNQEDGVNGDLIGGNLQEIIKKLPKDASIGFIGDSNSPAYQQLKSAGFTNLGEPLTETIVPGKKFMQGQEFDYVVIDKMTSLPDSFEEKYSTVNFLKRFYTLMSRGKNASIFLDSTPLSKLIGQNIQDDIKSSGFSLKGQIEDFRTTYLNSLSKLELQEVPQQEEAPKQPEVKEENGELVISPLVEETPEFNLEATEDTIQQGLENQKEELYNELEDQTQPEVQSIEVSTLSDLLIEANTVVPITGLRETLINPDGTQRRYPMWLPGEKTPVRRNINAFYTEDTPITKRVDKQRLQDTISKIQSAIIFGGDIRDASITSLIGFNEAWKNRKLQLEIRKATEYDNFGIGTDLKPTYIDVNGEAYIASITCRLDGLSKSISDTPYSAIIDICLLSDFNNLRKPQVQQAIKDKIDTKIKEGKITGDAIIKARNFRDNLGESVKQYEQFMRKAILDNPNGYSLELTPDMYESHQTTRLVKRKNPRRLGGTLSIATVENNIIDQDGNYIEDYNNFLDTDKRKVVSPVYIVGNKSDILKGKVSESVFGKAVVFVSSNINLPADKLADMYIEQKRNPNTHTPEVRMVLLNNHGLSFTELITHRIQKQLSGEGQKSKKPWRMDTLGVRMFTAMWNFRAGLENFISQLDKWKSENKYDSNKVLAITKVEAELFNEFGNNWSSQINSKDQRVENLYSRYNIKSVDLENLIKFNQEYCKDIPTFRLGIDFTNTNVGGYVRSFDVSTSSVYGKRQANLLAIEEEYANKYHSLLSNILEQLTANEPPPVFKKIGFQFKPMATKLVKPDGQNFRTNEYIGKNDQQRNLSGLIHTNNKNITIGETDNNGNIISTAEIPAEALFSFFPKAISAIATKSRIYQTNTKASGLISISTIDTKDNKNSFDFDIEQLFKDNLLQKKGSDNTLFNMFNLIFHGTIQSLESKHAYTEDAPFKYGIFVDPDLESSNDYKQINVRGQNGKDYAFLRCGTNPVYFNVDVDVISGGIALNLSKVLNAGKEQVKQKSEVEIPKIVGYSSSVLDEQQKLSFQNYILNNGLDDTLDSYAEFVAVQSNKALINFFKSGNQVKNILELINFNTAKSFKDVRYENGKVKYTDQEGNTGELTLDTEDMFINAIPDKSNSLEEITKQSFNSKVVNYAGEDIMSHQEFLNLLEEEFQNDQEVQMLANSSNIENYLEMLVGVKDSLNNKIEMLEESENKWNLSDYLLYVDTTCF